MNTSFTRALTCAFTIACAVFLVEAAWAQSTFRTEVYPMQTVTLSTADFLLGKKDGKPATIAGELRIPKPGTDRLPPSSSCMARAASASITACGRAN
jgi:hypothetical protein